MSHGTSPHSYSLFHLKFIQLTQTPEDLYFFAESLEYTIHDSLGLFIRWYRVLEMKMDIFLLLYVVNATLLLLHEIESAYEKEWEILRLPGGISGFLLMHIPIIIFLFYGLIEIQKSSTAGGIIGLVIGVGGIIPLIVHKVIVRREKRFNRLISNLILYLNALSGVVLFVFSFSHLS